MKNAITPGISVGPIKLGMTREQVLGVCGRPLQELGNRPEVVTILDYGAIRVGLDHRTVNMLVVEDATGGAMPDGTRVGTSWAELVESRGEPSFEPEEMGSWEDASESGIWYAIASPLMPGEQTLDPPYHEELYVVRDPDHAFVRRIYVMRPSSDSAATGV